MLVSQLFIVSLLTSAVDTASLHKHMKQQHCLRVKRNMCQRAVPSVGEGMRGGRDVEGER
jgi:hypothetical protein